MLAAMAWTAETLNGKTTIVGVIGDPLVFEVEVTYDGVLDFDDATWECQIRRTVPGPTVGTPELVDSNVETVDGDPGTTTVQLTFKVDDTTVFGDKVTYYFGVRAVGGATPRTLIVASPIVGRTPIAH